MKATLKKDVSERPATSFSILPLGKQKRSTHSKGQPSMEKLLSKAISLAKFNLIIVLI